MQNEAKDAPQAARYTENGRCFPRRTGNSCFFARAVRGMRPYIDTMHHTE